MRFGSWTDEQVERQYFYVSALHEKLRGLGSRPGDSDYDFLYCEGLDLREELYSRSLSPESVRAKYADIAERIAS